MIFDEDAVKKLVIQWQESEDDALLAEILKGCGSLVEVIVSRYGHRYRDDLIQEATLKIIESLDKFDSERGKLHSFLTSVIRNKCVTYVQERSSNINVSDEIIESGIIKKHSAYEYSDDEQLLDDLIERNRKRFPSLPSHIVDPMTRTVYYSTRDGIKGKSRGTISKMMGEHDVGRNVATVVYHSTVMYMRLSLLDRVDNVNVEDPGEFTLLRDFQDVVGRDNCKEIAVLFSGMYVKFP